MLSNIYKIGRRFSLSSIERDFSTTQEICRRLWLTTQHQIDFDQTQCLTIALCALLNGILRRFLTGFFSSFFSQQQQRFLNSPINIPTAVLDFRIHIDIFKTQLLQDDGEKKESRLSVSHFGRWITKNPFTAYGRLSIVLRLLLNYNYYVQLWMRSDV